MAFLAEADALKGVQRLNVLMDRSRRENVAEHSWHVALWALILSPDMPAGCDLSRAIAMLLIHDIVEIDAGDHPVDIAHDPHDIARKEHAAAIRLFGLLPPDQGAGLMALWREFEGNATPTARYAKRIDHMQPILQVFLAPDWEPGHAEVAAHTLTEGRARYMARDWPTLDAQARARMAGDTAPGGPLAARLAFLAEADQLKTVIRATLALNGARRENSAEHSWHVALYALILAEHAPAPVDPAKVITKLLLHDLVEIDAGDAPVFGNVDTAAIEVAEAAAADRLFGLLPDGEGGPLHALWCEFEANATPEARFAKSLDRFNPPNQNIAAGGGSWIEYGVTRAIFDTTVGAKIEAGAPILWQWIAPKAYAVIDRLQSERA
ncbi:HD domain-containing protein [Sagittula sp. M10.9X]|uniref:5'-deoxynucleotidase n=2 Tax=Sagittula salina TaxID=2820268 RepID=A0A940S2A7_9RHOB|nr:HD domain-containing protein [Sagittula salina]